MAKQTDSIKPPYVSFTTFVNSINKLREIGIPNRIDASVFMGQSGSAIAALLGAIKYFGFVDEDGIPNEKFAQLVDTSDEKRGEILKPILLDRYQFITNGDFDLASATSQQVEKAFRDQGISGSTVTKSVSFFLAAAQLAGLTTSPHVKAPKPPRSNSGVSKPKRRHNTTDNGIPATPPVHHASAAELLLGKFPNFDPTWPDDIKKQWFESFGTLQGMMGSDKPHKEGG